MDERIKVLHVISNCGIGGAQTLVRGIVSNTQNHYIYFLRKDKNDVFKDLQDKTFYFHSYKSHKFSLRILFQLNKIIKKNKFKILHIHLVKSLMYAYLIKIFNSKLKIVYHEHGLIHADDKTNKQPKWYIWYLRLLQGKVNKFVLISGHIYDLYLKQVKINEKKLELLYNFVNTKKFKKLGNNQIIQERKKLKLEKSDFVVGFAGRLIGRKGWQEFLLAAKELIKKDKNFKFLIAGTGSDKEKMLRVIQKNKLFNNVIYLGFVNDMGWFYSILDCFCMPSHWEPMGLTHLEAQEIGIPIIVTKVPCLNETVSNENCLFVEKNNPEDISAKILMLKNKDLKIKLVKKGLENVKKYSLSGYLKKLVEVYEDE